MNRLWIAPLALLGTLLLTGSGQAQTPRDIQNMIATGQESQAVQTLNNVLQQHPDSGVAWYLLAEAQDAQGNESAASQALTKAEQLAPGLPFANAQDAAALQARLASPLHSAGGGGHIGIFIIGGLILLFMFMRVMAGHRRGYVAPGYGAPGFGAQGTPFGYGNGPGYGPGGGGMGSSLLGGLAAGAGFAAGERIIDGMMGGQGQGWGGDPFGGGQGPAPGADDGLIGNPGWDNSGGGGGLSDDGNSGWS